MVARALAFAAALMEEFAAIAFSRPRARVLLCDPFRGPPFLFPDGLGELLARFRRRVTEGGGVASSACIARDTCASCGSPSSSPWADRPG